MATAAVPTRAVQIKDEAAYMACGLWMIIGLYVDGWSHQANKPETFFTPWHALLYSGFGAAILWTAHIGLRDAKRGIAPAVGDDRVTTLGVALFSLGAVGDFAWHSLVGIEVDIEGLISPTHLLLMVGGLLMVTLPVRSALRSDEAAGIPVFASIALAMGVAAFFLMYLMPWDARWAFEGRYVPESDLSNLRVATGMASVLVTTALFVGMLCWSARRWTLPFGTATVTFTAVAFGVAALDGFEVSLSVLAATLAGLVFDVLLRDGRSLHVVGAASGLALWSAFFALHHAEAGIGWGPSLWAGALVFATLTGLAAGVAVRER
jgi:hypothetical protein